MDAKLELRKICQLIATEPHMPINRTEADKQKNWRKNGQFGMMVTVTRVTVLDQDFIIQEITVGEHITYKILLVQE